MAVRFMAPMRVKRAGSSPCDGEGGTEKGSCDGYAASLPDPLSMVGEREKLRDD